MNGPFSVDFGASISDVKKPKIHLCYHEKLLIDDKLINIKIYPNHMVYCRECNIYMTSTNPTSPGSRGIVIEDEWTLTLAKKWMHEYEEKEREENEWTTKW